MPEKNQRRSHALVRNAFSGIAIFVVSSIWVLIYIFFLKDAFWQLSASNVVDLSKTLIQSVGILASLIIASSFVYVGKLDELTIRLLSEESALDNKREAIGFRIIAATDVLKKCYAKLSELDDNKLAESSLLAKKELEETLKELDNANKENSKLLEKIKKYGVNEFINELEKLKGMLLAFLAFVVGVFLIAIILAIVAFVQGSGRTLGESLIAIVFGMILLFAVWYLFHTVSRLMRDFFRILLSTKTTLSMIGTSVRECKSELDEASKKISTLSAI